MTPPGYDFWPERNPWHRGFAVFHGFATLCIEKSWVRRSRTLTHTCTHNTPCKLQLIYPSIDTYTLCYILVIEYSCIHIYMSVSKLACHRDIICIMYFIIIIIILCNCQWITEVSHMSLSRTNTLRCQRTLSHMCYISMSNIVTWHIIQYNTYV